MKDVAPASSIEVDPSVGAVSTRTDDKPTEPGRKPYVPKHVAVVPPPKPAAGASKPGTSKPGTSDRATDKLPAASAAQPQIATARDASESRPSTASAAPSVAGAAAPAPEKRGSVSGGSLAIAGVGIVVAVAAVVWAKREVGRANDKIAALERERAQQPGVASGVQPSGTQADTPPGGTQPSGTQPGGTQPGGTPPGGTPGGGTPPSDDGTANAVDPKQPTTNDSASDTTPTDDKVSDTAATKAATPTTDTDRDDKGDNGNKGKDDDGAASGEAQCNVRVTSNARGAEVVLDGRVRGLVGAAFTTRCRTAKLVVRHPKFETETKVVKLVPETKVHVDLEKAQVEITVNSTPPGALITTSSGRVLGKTPLVTKVEKGAQETLFFKMPGKASDWRRIIPKTNMTLNVTLQPLPK